MTDTNTDLITKYQHGDRLTVGEMRSIMTWFSRVEEAAQKVNAASTLLADVLSERPIGAMGDANLSSAIKNIGASLRSEEPTDTILLSRAQGQALIARLVDLEGER